MSRFAGRAGSRFGNKALSDLMVLAKNQKTIRTTKLYKILKEIHVTVINKDKLIKELQKANGVLNGRAHGAESSLKRAQEHIRYLEELRQKEKI